MLAKLTVWGLLLAITSEGPIRPEIDGNSEPVPFKRKENKEGEVEEWICCFWKMGAVIVKL